MANQGDMAACIKSAYRTLVLRNTGQKITIADICAEASVSRRTFYAYFDSKIDLVDAIFYDDTLRGIEELLPYFLAKKKPDVSVPLFTEMVFQGIYDNKEFYQRIVEHDSTSMFANTVARCSTTLYRRSSERDHIALDEKLSYAFCFSGAGLAGIITKWIRDGMTIPPKELAAWLEEWSFPVAKVGFRIENEA